MNLSDSNVRACGLECTGASAPEILAQHQKQEKGKRINYSPAADSFCASCFAGTGRAAAARNAAFFRRK